MSDSPPEETPTTSGSWHQPSTPGTWREPPKPEKLEGWRLPALPVGLKEEPVETGSWHIPRPEDTPYEPEDELEVMQRPEDAVFDFIFPEEPVAESPVAPEDDPELAPEDLMFLIETDEDANTGVGMSELMALASLVDEGTPDTDVLSGIESHIPASLVLMPDADTEEDDLKAEMLSPAERMMLQGTAVSEDDPAAYARQQLEKLGVSADAEQQGATPAPVTAESDPAEYARQQMEKLSGGDTSAIVDVPIVTGDTRAPHATQPVLTHRQQELARSFRETETKVRTLRGQMHAGMIDQATFMAKLREMMILDDDQVWWMMGVETDTWYRAENNNWVEAVPEVLQLEQAAAQPSAPSLSYIPDTAPQPTGFTPSGSDIRLDSNFMPLPREVPIQDPEATVPNIRVIDQFGQPDPHSQQTVAHTPYGGGMAQPVQYGTIESPFDEEDLAAPDYDLDRAAPYYDEAQRRQRMSTGRILALMAGGGLVLVFLAGIGFVVTAMMWYNGVVGQWEAGIASLDNYQPVFQTLTLLDSAGNTIANLGQEGNDRRPIRLDQVSPYLIHAIISLENERFYDDPGWDMIAIVRAFWQNYTAGSLESGASTITQQVARHLVLQNTEVTTERKMNEIVVAGELSRRYDKNFILELYLNEVAFFGNGSYGVEAAAQFYFKKHASDLNMTESALLASIIRSPANNEPVNNRQMAQSLMKATIQRMATVGCLDFLHTPPFGDRHFCIDPALRDFEQAKGVMPDFALELAQIEVMTFQPREFSVRYPHFTQLVKNQLEALLGSNIYSGGYVVTTTLDSALQNQAQQILASHVSMNSVNGVTSGAVMVTDPRNGAVLALVGSPDFSNKAVGGEIDFARTYQQPGSSIKPILYAAALQGVDRNGNGVIELGEYYTPATVLWDVQTNYANNYTPRNYDGRYHGPAPMRYALQNSYNIPAIKTYEFIGETHFRAVAEAMGLRFIDTAQFNITSAIGSTEVRLFDMMKAYGTLASNGVRRELYLIESVVDANGNPVAIPPHDDPVQVLSPQTAFLMQNILSDNNARTEQFGANSGMVITGIPTQGYLAAKTGTTDGGRDLWTMGFTHNRVVGVWMGTHDDSQTYNTTGAVTAAPVWNKVMTAALQNNAAAEFHPPPGITARQICVDTGALPNDICVNIRNEYFSYPPPPADQSFGQMLAVDSWTGLLANQFCPDNVTESYFANITDPYAVQWLNTQGQDYARRIGLEVPVQIAPQSACDQSTPIPVVRMSSPGGGQTIQGQFAVIGQVSAQGFDRYQLEYASMNDPANFVLADGPHAVQQPNANSMLGTWNTTAVSNGDYILRLAVFSTTGGHLYRTAMVSINNPLPTQTPTPPPQPTPAPMILPSPIPFDVLNTPMPPDGMATPTVDPLG